MLWALYCDAALFTAYEPPSALTTKTTLNPPVPPSDPKSPVSSGTLDPPARSTTGSEASTPVPASTPKLDQPKVTTSATLVRTNLEKPSTRSHVNDPTTHERPQSLAQVV